jgi:hypothetical protein
VKQRLEVDELGRVIDVELLQVAQHLILDVGHQFVVGPDVVEPFLEFGAVTVTIDDQVELDVGRCRQAKTAPGEV